jgi:hypothetical protein
LPPTARKPAGRRPAIVPPAELDAAQWLAELDLPGESYDVAYAPQHQVAGLIGSPENFIPGERGLLHFVDVSNPGAPRLKQSYSMPTVAIDPESGSWTP